MLKQCSQVPSPLHVHPASARGNLKSNASGDAVNLMGDSSAAAAISFSSTEGRWTESSGIIFGFGSEFDRGIVDSDFVGKSTSRSNTERRDEDLGLVFVGESVKLFCFTAGEHLAHVPNPPQVHSDCGNFRNFDDG